MVCYRAIDNEYAVSTVLFTCFLFSTVNKNVQVFPPLAMVMCLWSSQPGFLSESSTLTILIRSLFTSQHALGSGYKQSHSNISSGLFLPLRKCRTSVSHSVFSVSPTYLWAKPTLKKSEKGVLWTETWQKHFFFFFGMDYAWPSVKCERLVYPSVWPKGYHENSSFSQGLCLLLSTGFRTNPGVWFGQETKQPSPHTPSVPPPHAPQHQRTNFPSTTPSLPSWN